METSPPLSPAQATVGPGPLRRVVSLMDASAGHTQGILRGIRAFAHSRPDWILRHALGNTQPQMLLKWHPAGVIVYGPPPQTLRILRSHRLSLVTVLHPIGELPMVALDDYRVGGMVAQDLINRGFRELAMVGVFGQDWSNLRRDGFLPTARAAGCRIHTYEIRLKPPLRPLSFNRIGLDPALRRWLEKLPKPAAVFAANDLCAREIVQICNSTGIRVPEQLAVMGVDNDEFICQMTDPELSSVDIPWQKIGYQAATVLDEIMRTGKPTSGQIFVPPSHVVTRQSTDSVAAGDPAVAAALRFIYHHAHEGINVTHVLQSVLVARRRLERRFFKELGRTPLQEIHRVRLERAKRLLAETDLSIDAIGLRCGIPQSRLSVVFHKATGLTPTQWRRRYRAVPDGPPFATEGGTDSGTTGGPPKRET